MEVGSKWSSTGLSFGAWVFHFYYRATAKHTHGIAIDILSVCLPVCPSVCLSVKRVYCDKTR